MLVSYWQLTAILRSAGAVRFFSFIVLQISFKVIDGFSVMNPQVYSLVFQFTL